MKRATLLIATVVALLVFVLPVPVLAASSSISCWSQWSACLDRCDNATTAAKYEICVGRCDDIRTACDASSGGFCPFLNYCPVVVYPAPYDQGSSL